MQHYGKNYVSKLVTLSHQKKMCSNINPSSTDENHTVNSPNHTLAVDSYFFPDNKFLVFNRQQAKFVWLRTAF